MPTLSGTRLPAIGFGATAALVVCAPSAGIPAPSFATVRGQQEAATTRGRSSITTRAAVAQVVQPSVPDAGRSFVLPLALCGVAASSALRRRRQTQRRKGAVVSSTVALQAYASAPQTYEGAPIGPPPDLPSLLLKNRIVYLGLPITAEVTELVVAQLLYLNYESADKPVTMYINSTGSTMKNNTRYIGEQKVGLETDAFAIADCMQYIKPKITTIAIGQAYGTAAMLLGLGAKGKRFALPNATIMLSEPREPPARGPRQASDIRIMAREVLRNRSTMADLMAIATGKDPQQVVDDTKRCVYMSPVEAVEYNLIDKVLTNEKLKESGAELPSFVSAL